MTKVHTVEISFPTLVELPADFMRELDNLIHKVTRVYERKYPFRVMWAAGMGGRPSHGYEHFDMNVFSIEVAERANYDWPCAKCAYTLGNHKDHIFNPPAGNCDYEPAESLVLNYKGFKLRLFADHRARIARKRMFRRMGRKQRMFRNIR